MKKMSKNICDEQIFSSIYSEYSDDLHNYLYYKYGVYNDPNDTVQEAFTTLWQKCKEVGYSGARGFVFTVAKNIMLNKIKHDKVVLKYLEIPRKEYSHETPEFLLEQEQFYQKYQRALSKLTEEQRAVFLLNKVEGKKHQEIADMLNITKKVVEYRIYSAFKIIKDEIKEIKKL